MDVKKEDDLLEETLSISETDYAQAYRFLLAAYEKEPGGFGPQTLYFLACLAGGAGMQDAALSWLRTAIEKNGWWYRPEVLVDDDLAQLEGSPEFLALKARSDARYADAVSAAKSVFSWNGKTADYLFLAVHGNTQNAQTARTDWAPILAGDDHWQLETIQSAEPDGYGTFRWSYDDTSFLPVANALDAMQGEGYDKIACGGFSAGCDMLLRAIAFTPARCDLLILQSPWLPVLQAHKEAILQALRQKDIALRIFCGADDEDCLPLAQALSAAAYQAGLDAALTVQENCRHQFPETPCALNDLPLSENPA
ncbi:MAG: hypothetical protein KHY01_04770 [Firmicutes bacterium]|nr:hypothetical protein [Bacillota bacterium]